MVGNNPVVPDPSREQTDLDKETNFTTNAGEAHSEIHSTMCTNHALRQEHSNTLGNNDSTASPQTDSEITPADTEEESQQEQTQMDSTKSLHMEVIEGEPQQGNPSSAEDSSTFDDMVPLDPDVHNNHVTSYLGMTQKSPTQK